MTGTTTNGWPYVTPDDHPLEFPTHSQELANLLDSRTKSRSVAVTMRAGWVTGNLGVTRVGSWVMLSLVSVQKSTAPAASEVIADLPLGYRPAPNLFNILRVFDANSGSGFSDLIIGPATIACTSPAPAQTLKMYGSAVYYTVDALPA